MICIYRLSSEEVGRAQFSLATPIYATVAYSIRNTVLFINKIHSKLLPRGVQGCTPADFRLKQFCTMMIGGSFGFIFFFNLKKKKTIICSFKITCKPFRRKFKFTLTCPNSLIIRDVSMEDQAGQLNFLLNGW